MRTRAFLALLLWFPVAGIGQVSGSGTQATYTANLIPSTPITGAPYSCDRVMETVMTLSDGTHTTASSAVRTYRDSQGRTRTERYGIGLDKGNPGGYLLIDIELLDYVAGFGYILEPGAKVAHRIAVKPPPGNGRTNIYTPSGWAQPWPTRTEVKNGKETTTEYLGRKTLAGIQTEGRRITTTYPPGSQGNGRPLVTTSELWRSPEIGLVVVYKQSDPRAGETTETVSNVSRAEPDISLFRPPSDYAIVDQTPGPNVTIHYAIPK